MREKIRSTSGTRHGRKMREASDETRDWMHAGSKTSLSPHLDDTIPTAGKDRGGLSRMPNAANGRSLVVGPITLEHSANNEYKKEG